MVVREVPVDGLFIEENGSFEINFCAHRWRNPRIVKQGVFADKRARGE